MSFDDIAAARTRDAAAARIESLSNVCARDSTDDVSGIGNAWTRDHYGGDFEITMPPEGDTAVSLVFVQSRDGNTVAADPASLGGGATDKHLIYEGLSRVAADAVLAGAGSVYPSAFFSVWHPELVALRQALGLPRHPAQVVISKHGHLDFDALLFNVPGVPAFIVTGDDVIADRAEWLRARPWVHAIPLVGDDLRAAVDHLRVTFRIRRMSAIGGRFTASRLADAGLVRDLYLTTTSYDGGEPGTPWYAGAHPPRLELITRKEWNDRGSVVAFEHFRFATADASGISLIAKPERSTLRSPHLRAK
jgi:riboflavin biosynthesis pyrimidine reductase